VESRRNAHDISQTAFNMATVFYEVVFRWGDVSDNEFSECVTRTGEDENDTIQLFNNFLAGAWNPPGGFSMPIMQLRKITQTENGGGSVETLQRVDLREQEWWAIRLAHERKWEELLDGEWHHLVNDE
jgi:hypothetical protein